MNGRAYDYNLGRFLSVDPFIQAHGNSQGLNPYSYIMNNPLSGTDPTGYKIVSESFDCLEYNCGAMLSGMGTVKLETNNGQERIQTVTGTRQEVDQKAEELLGQGYKRELDRTNEDGTVTETFVKPVSGGTSLRDIAKDPDEWLESLTVYTKDNGGFSTNSDIKAAIEEENKKEPVDGDLSSTEEQRSFVVEAHKVVGEHLKRLNKRRGSGREVELIMEIRQSAGGDMIVSNAFLAELGAKVPMTKSTDFVVHWHHQTNDCQAGQGDNLITRNIGISNFAVVMDRTGKKYTSIYEVGRPNGTIQQRKINLRTGSPGAWHNSPKWHEEWN